MRPPNLRWLVSALMATCLFGCWLDGAPTPDGLEKVQGDGQLGIVGEPLEQTFTVRVTDQRGDAYLGADVAFTVTSGSGVMNRDWERCDPPPGYANPAKTVTVQTTAGGYAWVSMVPAYFGVTTVEAEVVGEVIPSVSFTVEASDPDAAVEVAKPYEQEVIAGPGLDQWLEVFVRDALDNGVPGVPLTWEITSGAGRLRHVSPGCEFDETPTGLISRTSTFQEDGYAGLASVKFQAVAFGVTTVTASVAGIESATFTVDATAVEIDYYSSTGDPFFVGPDYSADVSVSIGATVEWSNETGREIRIVSTSHPAAGAPIDSGPIASRNRFRFVPDVAGTWEFVEKGSGAQGRLIVS